ncbi:MAG TPA: hypothetical protein VG604_02070 [Candidatus Saccharimonadales bacterium]|nr:hypothetical protein [Candidatus Saccharimonadales bacterium]
MAAFNEMTTGQKIITTSVGLVLAADISSQFYNFLHDDERQVNKGVAACAANLVDHSVQVTELPSGCHKSDGGIKTTSIEQVTYTNGSITNSTHIATSFTLPSAEKYTSINKVDAGNVLADDILAVFLGAGISTAVVMGGLVVADLELVPGSEIGGELDVV